MSSKLDVLTGLTYVETLLTEWCQQGYLRDLQLRTLASKLAERKAAWTADQAGEFAKSAEFTLPLEDPELTDPEAARTLWLNEFAADEIQRFGDTGLIGLSQADACLAELRERTAALRQQILQKQGSVPPLERPRPPAEGRRNFLEILLDPRSIQWLLGSGGALMVLGLVILLWINDVFTKPVLAATLAAVNAGLLALGWFVIRKTRYQIAGRAVTLLACLIMPLNLWYLHTNDLITLDGHLWVAAVLISALYAASAWFLRDEMFVYIFVGGVTMTGLLILCDLPPSPDRFLEIALPSTLLVVLGLLAIHVERAFPDEPGPFGRDRFGLAFFWSGHVLLAAGLLLVFGAQLAGNWLYEPFFKRWYLAWGASPSPIVDDLRPLALGLVLAGAYAYVYSDLVVRRVGAYLYLAAATLLWAEVLIVEQLHLQLGIDAIIIILASTALAVNLVQATILKGSSLTRSFPVLGLLLGLLPVLLGLFVYVEAISGNFRSVWVDQPPTWSYLIGMLLTAVSCQIGATLYRDTAPRLAAIYFFAAGASLLVGVVALLAALGMTTWQQHAPIVMLIPIVYLLIAHFRRGRAEEYPLLWVAHTGTAVMLVSSLTSAVSGFTGHEGSSLHLALAAFCAEAALFYGLAAGLRKQIAAVHLATLMACGAVWQLLTYAAVAPEYYTLTFAIVGLALLVAYRFAVIERFAAVELAKVVFQSANTLLSLSFVAAAFLALSRLFGRNVDWMFVILCATLGGMALIAAALVRQTAWRRWYIVAAIGQGLLTFLAVQVLSTLTPWQKLEIFSIIVGLLLLVIGHLGWYREQNRHSDTVTLCLLLGSLLTGIPLAIATIVDRYRGNFEGFYVLNELGFLTVGVLLLLTGVLFRLRSTTLVGAGLTALYFISLLVLVPWSRLNTVAIFILAGGGAIFTLGLLLSVYRERLLTLPDRIKRREGVFRVFDWR